MTKFELKAKPWGDEYIFGSYIVFLADGKEIWESSLAESCCPEEIYDLREEVKNRLDRLIEPVKYDISSYDVYEWKILE